MKHTFQVGDIVRVLPLEEINRDAGTVCFVPGMDQYCGKLAEITRIRREGVYSLSIDGDAWSWSSDWFSLEETEEEATEDIPESIFDKLMRGE